MKGRALLWFASLAAPSMAQSPLVSPDSSYPINVQFFILGAFLLLAAWLIYLYYHHSRENGKDSRPAQPAKR